MPSHDARGGDSGPGNKRPRTDDRPPPVRFPTLPHPICFHNPFALTSVKSLTRMLSRLLLLHAMRNCATATPAVAMMEAAAATAAAGADEAWYFQ